MPNLPIKHPISAAAVAALALLSACDSPPSQGKNPVFDAARLERIIDRDFGGVGTCMLIAQTGSGRRLYRYGSGTVCRRKLPPCSTFEIPSTLIALDAGAVNPATVLRWDGKPQPVSAWERDTDLRTAFTQSVGWWHQQVARGLGKPAYEQRLKAFGYGEGAGTGPVEALWAGPAEGGGLVISTDNQVEFLHRLYSGQLPVKSESAALVTSLMVDETHGSAQFSAKAGTCASQPDRTRQVGWSIGRVRSAKGDYVFAVSLEGSNDNSLPGAELTRRVKSAFAAVGLWPAAQGDAATGSGVSG